MKHVLLILLFVFNTALAQQKESTVSLSCYVNPQLYIQAGVIAHVSDKSGKASCNGRYVTINNKSRTIFNYKMNNRWLVVKPQGRTVFLFPSATTSTSKAASIFKLQVKYQPDASGNISAKLSTISQMNAQTDQVKARELEGNIQKKQEQIVSKPAAEPVPDKPSSAETPKTGAVITTANKEVSEPTTPKASTKTPPQQNKPAPAKKRVIVKAKPKVDNDTKRRPVASTKQETRNRRLASSTAVGLRVDFGTGATGLGPNIKHKFNKNFSLDASLVFFEGGAVGISGQLEQSFPVKGSPGLEWYIGIGPQFLSSNSTTAMALVPLTGVQYNIPNTPLNFSVDWRPNFYITPTADTQAGRFGLSLRYAF